VRLSPRTGAAANEQTNKQTNKQPDKQTDTRTSCTRHRLASLRRDRRLAVRAQLRPCARQLQPRLARKANRPAARWRTSRLHASGRAARSVRSRRRCGSGCARRRSAYARRHGGDHGAVLALGLVQARPTSIILHGWRLRDARVSADRLRRLDGLKPGRGRWEACSCRGARASSAFRFALGANAQVGPKVPKAKPRGNAGFVFSVVPLCFESRWTYPTGSTHLAMASSALPGLPGYGELGLRGVESAREPVGCGVARLAQRARLHDMRRKRDRWKEAETTHRICYKDI
jgi:hypothetical protein